MTLKYDHTFYWNMLIAFCLMWYNAVLPADDSCYAANTHCYYTLPDGSQVSNTLIWAIKLMEESLSSVSQSALSQTRSVFWLLSVALCSAFLYFIPFSYLAVTSEAFCRMAASTVNKWTKMKGCREKNPQKQVSSLITRATAFFLRQASDGP